jgi:hypothetical protein
VFIAINSTPATPSLTMRVTAFDPPPPSPTTLILTELAEKFDLAMFLLLLLLNFMYLFI